MASMVTRTDASIAAVTNGTASSWGLGDGQAIPWEYAPAPEARDIVRLKERYGLFINGREVPSADGDPEFVAAGCEPVERGLVAFRRRPVFHRLEDLAHAPACLGHGGASKPSGGDAPPSSGR